jgi:uncharacterized membrane protein YfcA
MLVGAVLRVEVLDGPRTFLFVVAGVLAPLGALLLGGGRTAASRAGAAAGPGVTAIAFGAGVLGGLYGIGGGSLIAPVLAWMGYSLFAIAPAALTSTFVTSVVGVLAFQALELVGGDGTIAPEWGLGLSMGLGGLAGGYLGAHLQRRAPEERLRRLLGVVCLLLAARYALDALGVLG